MFPDRLYAYFERLVSAALLLGMAVVILLATFSFLRSVGEASIAFTGPLDYTSFQLLFDRVLAAIIALELAHSVHQMVSGHRGMAQVKTVVVIGLLAIVRKLILLEIETTSGLFLLGIAATVLSLGIVFTLVQWVERRHSAATEIATPGANPMDNDSKG
ncbi:MAG: phosphate-starvation-inducible PsiE family protein [Roseovarius sp.]